MLDNVIPTLADILAGRGTRAVSAGEVRRYNLSVRGVRKALDDIENDTGWRPCVCFATPGEAATLLADISDEGRLIVDSGTAAATTSEEAARGLRFAFEVVGLRVLAPNEETLRHARDEIVSRLASYGAAVVNIGAATMTTPGHVSVPVTFAAAIDKIAMTIGFDDSPKPGNA